MDRKLFKDVKAGDIIWTTYGSVGYDLIPVKITDVEHITHETRHYKDWAYGEDEYFEVPCNKIKLSFDELSDEKCIYHKKISSLVIYLDYENGKGSSFENISHWYTTKEELIEFYKQCIDSAKEKLQQKIDSLKEEVSKHLSLADKFYKNIENI